MCDRECATCSLVCQHQVPQTPLCTRSICSQWRISSFCLCQIKPAAVANFNCGTFETLNFSRETILKHGWESREMFCLLSKECRQTCVDCCLSVQVSVLPRCTTVSAVLDAHSLSEGLQVSPHQPRLLSLATSTLFQHTCDCHHVALAHGFHQLA